MNLYLVTRSECDYDEHDAFVVAAPSEDKALMYLEKLHNSKGSYATWPNNGDKVAELIGTTHKYTALTEVIGSFNAG